MGRGGIRPEDYANFKTGISSIQGHIFVGRINGENAGTYASEVMYLAASLLKIIPDAAGGRALHRQHYIGGRMASICSRRQASCKYVSAYGRIFGYVSAYDRHPWRGLGARRDHCVAMSQ